MTTAEKVELAFIPCVGMIVWTLATYFPATMGLGTLVLWASALLLLQGLVRDSWLLRKTKQDTQTGSIRMLSCICVESTVGVTGVVLGLVLLGAGLSEFVVMNRWEWCLATIVVMTIGFAVKDYVFGWRPFRILRIKDHSSIVFTWKK